jgi:transcription initiation factor IIE alpha subunit
MYNFTFICRAGKEAETLRVDHSKSNFECPACKLLLTYIHSTKKLGAHGRSEQTLQHELRQVTELGKS